MSQLERGVVYTRQSLFSRSVRDAVCRVCDRPVIDTGPVVESEHLREHIVKGELWHNGFGGYEVMRGD